MRDLPKKNDAPGWPPAEGCYLRGNESSPVAVVVILHSPKGDVPPEIDRLVSVAVVAGAAIAGTLQTENIGVEKVICNLVSNPNIRHLLVCGPEAPGHRPGDAILALARGGTDGAGRIVGAEGRNPCLYNLPGEYVARFREQIRVHDLIGEQSEEAIAAAVRACCGKGPALLDGKEVSDPGAFPAEPLSGRIEWRVTEPDRKTPD